MRHVFWRCYFLFSFLIGSTIAVAQTSAIMNKPTILPSHPLGIFASRIDHRLANSPSNKLTFQATYSSANVWLPQVIGIIPNDPSTRNYLSQLIWHKRDSVYQGLPQNHDSSVFRADGVLRTIQLDLIYSIAKKHQLKIGITGMLLTEGRIPFSLLTSDEFIETFHSKIAGGEDPFARKHYGFNKAEIYFQPTSGKSLRVKNKTLLLPTIQLSYYYQMETPWLTKNNIQIGLGSHVGFNNTRYNRSVSLGISGYINKSISIKSSQLTLAIATSLIRNAVFDWSDNFKLVSNIYTPSLETHFEYRHCLKDQKFWSVGLNFLISAPYNNPNEANTITPRGDRISSHWHLAYTHLYRNNQNWSLIFAYGKKHILMIYINEDFKVNNAPDIQTGIGFLVPIK